MNPVAYVSQYHGVVLNKQVISHVYAQFSTTLVKMNLLKKKSKIGLTFLLFLFSRLSGL